MTQAEWAAKKYALLIEPLQKTARRYGYALATHGSLRRDIDLIAVPWVEEAAEPDFLVAALMACLQRVNKIVFTRPEDPDWPHDKPGSRNPTEKPHGRLAWSLHLGPTYIDLSVMPLKSGL